MLTILSRKSLSDSTLHNVETIKHVAICLDYRDSIFGDTIAWKAQKMELVNRDVAY